MSYDEHAASHDQKVLRFFLSYGPALLLTAHPAAFVFLALGADPLPFAAVAALEALVLGSICAVTWPYRERDERSTRVVEWNLDGFEAKWSTAPAAVGEDTATLGAILGALGFIGGVCWIPAALLIHPHVESKLLGFLLVVGLAAAIPLAVFHYGVGRMVRSAVNGLRARPVVSVELRARRLTVDGVDWTRSADDQLERRAGELVIRNGSGSIRVRGGLDDLAFLEAELAKSSPDPEVRRVPEALEALR